MLTYHSPSPQALHNKKVLSCPILDIEDDQYNGCLSVNDILRDLISSTCDCLRPPCFHASTHATTVLDDDEPGWLDDEGVFDADTLLYLGRKFCDRPVKDLAHVGELWLHEADNCSSLLDLVLESLASQAVHAHHRVFIASPGKGESVTANHGITSIALKPGLERKNSTGLKVVGVVSQSDVVALLWNARAELEGPLSATLEDLELAEVWCCCVVTIVMYH